MCRRYIHSIVILRGGDILFGSRILNTERSKLVHISEEAVVRRRRT